MSNAKHSSSSMEWRTPDRIIIPSHETMGGIDRDPATTKRANKAVRAKRIFTLRDDGLRKKWRGRIFVNPPGGDLMSPWLIKPDKKNGIDGRAKPKWLIERHREIARRAGTRSHAVAWWVKLIDQIEKGHATEAIFVAFSIEFLQTAQKIGYGLGKVAICIPEDRIPFNHSDGTPGEQPTHSNAILYLGPHVGSFAKAFAKVGDVHNSTVGVSVCDAIRR